LIPPVKVSSYVTGMSTLSGTVAAIMPALMSDISPGPHLLIAWI